jgi:hypothetical protein
MKEYGRHTKFSLVFNWTETFNESLQLGTTCGTEIYDKHTYGLYMKYYSEVNNYRCGDGAKHEVISDKWNFIKRTGLL